MSFRHVRQFYSGPTPEKPPDGALYGPEDLREQDLERFAARLYRELAYVRDWVAPEWAREEAKRLGIAI